MSDEAGSAVSIARRDQVRRGARATLGSSVGLATTTLGFLFLLTPTHRGSKGLVQIVDTASDGVRWFAANIGVPALSDAGWILPSLLAIVVGIYASDYGARRRLSAHEDLLPTSEDERRVLRLLKDIGILIAAFAVDYFVLSILTVLIEGSGYGHLIGVTVLGLLIVALGVSVGAFAIESPERLLRANDIAFGELNKREQRIAAAVTRRPVLVMVIWLAAPWGLLGLALVLLALLPGVPFFYWAAWTALLVALLSPAVAIAASHERDFRVGSAESRASAAWVIIICGLWSWAWADIMVPIAVAAGFVAIAALLGGGVLLVLYAIAWFSPLNPGDSPRWPWSPGAAHLTMMGRGCRRREKKLLIVRERIQNYARDLDDAARSAAGSPRRRGRVLVAGRWYQRDQRNVDN